MSPYAEYSRTLRIPAKCGMRSATMVQSRQTSLEHFSSLPSATKLTTDAVAFHGSIDRQRNSEHTSTLGDAPILSCRMLASTARERDSDCLIGVVTTSRHIRAAAISTACSV